MLFLSFCESLWQSYNNNSSNLVIDSLYTQLQFIMCNLQVVFNYSVLLEETVSEFIYVWSNLS